MKLFMFMRPAVFVALLAGLWSSGLQPLLAAVPQEQEKQPTAVEIVIGDAPITPVVARYIEQGVQKAASVEAVCLIVKLDTPGGLMQATQQIVRSIVGSELPVVVYVAPSGARAASAGVFITLSAHVAAMAPGTHIGAAHPVSLGGSAPTMPSDTTNGQNGSGGSDVMGEKVINDAVAWVRSLAELRGRNAEWAARAVTESASLTSREALEQNVVDLLVSDTEELLQAIDGQYVTVAGDSVRLATEGAEVQTLEMGWGDQLLGVLANPNVAFLLMMFGFYGILFELYTPGWGVGGTLGAICLILAFSGLAVLPINYAGLALIFMGLGLFVAEAFVISFGLLTLGGVVCVILGGLMLVDTSEELLQVSAWIVVPVALATAAIAVFLVGQVVKSARTQVQTGSESMIGAVGVAQEAFAEAGEKYTGMVRIQGELWQAVSPGPVVEGQTVEVTHREGLTLFVQTVGEAGGQTVIDR